MDQRSPSPAEPVSRLRHVRIVECGDELVDFLNLCPDLRLDPPRYRYRRETLLRRSVAEKLCEANRRLSEGNRGFRLAVIEGWRAPHIQRRMYRALWNWFSAQNPDWSIHRLRRVVNRFSAPDDPRVPPPHTTGGAVDVMLADFSGQLLDHSSPYDPYDPDCYLFDTPALSETARQTRAILAEALLSTGLTNYPSEYWHWSYGDQGWAYRGGHLHACYGAIQPQGYSPDPAETVEAPLELL
jgi:D-alanyl-D-alanine dipeptidase